jgi:hypothetical protein
VTQGVGERLLQHAVGREIDTGRYVGKAALDMDLHVESSDARSHQHRRPWPARTR